MYNLRCRRQPTPNLNKKLADRNGLSVQWINKEKGMRQIIFNELFLAKSWEKLLPLIVSIQCYLEYHQISINKNLNSLACIPGLIQGSMNRGCSESKECSSCEVKWGWAGKPDAHMFLFELFPTICIGSPTNT